MIGNLNENTLSIFIRPREYTSDNRADVVLYIVEGIVRGLLQFLFPSTNQATLDYYTTILIFDRVFRIGMSETEKQEMRQQITSLHNQEIKEIPQFKREDSLSCPHCQSRSIEFVGIQNTGRVEFQAGVPILSTKSEDITIMAYYKCDSCKRVFYVQPKETPETE